MRPAKTKDRKLQAKRSGAELGELLQRVMEGEEPPPGAEGLGLKCLEHLVNSYLVDEGYFGALLRQFLEALQNKADPLRRDIPPELWAGLWPSLNTLAHKRSLYVRQQQEEALRDAEVLHPNVERSGRPPDDGAGLLRSDSAPPSDDKGEV